MTRSASRLEKLKEAIERASPKIMSIKYPDVTVSYSMSADDQEIIVEAARSYAAIMPLLRKIEHEYITTRGLYCIDKNPIDVDYDWIKRNAFQLNDDEKIATQIGNILDGEEE